MVVHPVRFLVHPLLPSPLTQDRVDILVGQEVRVSSRKLGKWSIGQHLLELLLHARRSLAAALVDKLVLQGAGPLRVARDGLGLAEKTDRELGGGGLYWE